MHIHNLSGASVPSSILWTNIFSRILLLIGIYSIYKSDNNNYSRYYINVMFRGVGTIFFMGGGYLFLCYIIYPIIYY